AVGGGTWAYSTVKLVKGGTVSGNNNSDSATISGVSLAWKDFGSTSDLWGLTLADTDCTASNFGGVLSLTNSSSGVSHYLKATNFAFSIPGGATINGVQLGYDIEVDPGAGGS